MKLSGFGASHALQVGHRPVTAGSPVNSALATDIKHVGNTIGHPALAREARAADTIKGFLRHAIAAQSYGSMFANGAYFKSTGNDFPRYEGKSSQASLDHLDKVSAQYLTAIKAKTPNLTPAEKTLLGKVIDAPWHYRHQSDAFLGRDTLNISSNARLEARGIKSSSHTLSADRECVSNHDFVFFGVEFAGDIAQPPVNTLHSGNDYGAGVYLVGDNFPLGYLTLTDHYDNIVPYNHMSEHEEFSARFECAHEEVIRRVHGDKGRNDAPLFNTKDMKLALGLHLIHFLRQSEDAEFKAFALNDKLNGTALDRVLNFVFQPEFHVPRMVSTTDFKSHFHRPMQLEDAVRASNYHVIDIASAPEARRYRLMGYAITNGKLDVVNHLLSRFTFDSCDLYYMASDDDNIAKRLTDERADIAVLRLLLAKELADPNWIVDHRRGETMLDHARSSQRPDIVALLLEYGARDE
nr:T3SS effector OspC family protein [uncultured Enterobacter sp.]